ncbi:hypothetical protein Hypma_003605 [Hypsizygus marmoreus]|uniref:F-box domain-containing protein n=1 Tax=Hypsizygus marmoreus TaxID=39966 RepID=A0A369J4B5_HYPMA|nr:hypothetical protein Hypma_003605 [Hypsizygus marmoreus]
MHHALAIPEILHSIFSHLEQTAPERDVAFENSTVFPILGPEPIPPEKGNGAALANAARCCKAFSIPALDILWSHQKSILPLLKILPSFKKSDENRKYMLTDMIQEYQFKRLQSFASRIRSMERYKVDSIDDLVFLQITELLKGQPLTPMLHTLTFPISNSIFLLISPRLCNITVVRQLSANKASILLQSLICKSPTLKNFSSFNCDMFSLNPSNWATLARLEHLQSLEIRNVLELDKNGLCMVLGMQQLTKLSLSFDQPIPQFTLPPTTQTYALRVLVLSAQTHFVKGLLACLVATPLTTLRIVYEDSGDIAYEESWLARLAVIAHWSDSLSELELQDPDVDGSGRLGVDSGVVRDISVLDPLLKVRGLRKLIFRPNITFDFSDDDFGRLARAWPAMEYLHFDLWGGIKVPSATFAALDAFVTCCPHLHSLSIRFDASRLPPSPRITTHRLRYLYIDYPIVEPINQVARYLDALCPVVAWVDGSDSLDITVAAQNGIVVGAPVDFFGKRRWNEVADMVKLCQVGRADDKQRHKLVTRGFLL